jgi:hypothetical protein
MRQTRYWTICGIVTLAMLAGCGRSGPELAPVGGRVTLDGQPIYGAQLRFQPEGSGSPSYGSTDREGQFELAYKRGQKGALIGWHTVHIEMNREVVGPTGETTKRPKSLPARYNTQSELRREVMPDAENEIDFELESSTK